MELPHRSSNSTFSLGTTNPATSASTLFPRSPHPSDEEETESDTNTYMTNGDKNDKDSLIDPSIPETLISVLLGDFDGDDMKDEWSTDSIRLFGALTFGDWVARHPMTGRCTAMISDEFLNDDFNAMCTDRWPQWSDFGDDEMKLIPEALFPINRPKPLLQFIRKSYEDQDDFEDGIQEYLRTDIRFLEDVSTLYSLIHQRFVFTKQGMLQMEERLLEGERMFGECPRTLCDKQFLLPSGRHNEPGKSRLLGYCPLCDELYMLGDRHSGGLDGALYGPTWAPFFIICHLKPRFFADKYELKDFSVPLFKLWNESSPDQDKAVYVPRIFGFKLANPT